MNKLRRIIPGFAFAVLFSTTVLSQTTHSVWSDKPYLVKDEVPGKEYKNLVKGHAAFAWTEATVRAYAHAVAVVSPVLNYDFMLIKTTSSDADSISGLWNVHRNGVLVCANCVGKAYLLSQPAAPANYFKIYVGTPAAYAEKWGYIAYIKERFDF